MSQSITRQENTTEQAIALQLTDATITLNQNLNDLLKRNSSLINSLSEIEESSVIPIPFDQNTFNLLVKELESLENNQTQTFQNIQIEQLSDLFKILDFFDVNQNINKQIAKYILEHNLVYQFINKNPDQLILLMNLIEEENSFTLKKELKCKVDNFEITSNNKHIVYNSSHAGKKKLVILSLLNKEQARILDNFYTFIITSDNKYIITKQEQTNNLFIINLDKPDEPAKIIGNASLYMITSDNKYIIARKNNRLFIINLSNLDMGPFQIDGKFYELQFIHNDRFIIFKEQKKLIIIDFNNLHKKPIKINKAFTEYTISPDNQHIFVKESKTEKTLSINLYNFYEPLQEVDYKFASTDTHSESKSKIEANFKDFQITPDRKYTVAIKKSDPRLFILNRSSNTTPNNITGNFENFKISSDSKIIIVKSADKLHVVYNLYTQIALELIENIEKQNQESLDFLKSSLSQNCQFYKDAFGETLLKELRKRINAQIQQNNQPGKFRGLK